MHGRLKHVRRIHLCVPLKHLEQLGDLTMERARIKRFFISRKFRNPLDNCLFAEMARFLSQCLASYLLAD